MGVEEKEKGFVLLAPFFFPFALCHQSVNENVSSLFLKNSREFFELAVSFFDEGRRAREGAGKVESEQVESGGRTRKKRKRKKSPSQFFGLTGIEAERRLVFTSFSLTSSSRHAFSGRALGSVGRHDGSSSGLCVAAEGARAGAASARRRRCRHRCSVIRCRLSDKSGTPQRCLRRCCCFFEAALCSCVGKCSRRW